jgi:hypothetical protein
MKNIKTVFSGTRVILVGIVIFLLLIVAAIYISRSTALAAPVQPIDFSHKRHTDAGLQCLFCHSQAQRSDIAGIPSVRFCIECHRTIATESEQIQILQGYWDRQEPIPWVAVNDLPDHTFFSHQVHIAAPLSCETCHGPVGTMDQLKPLNTMDMGWCLTCHLEQEDEEKVARLADCMACHQ